MNFTNKTVIYLTDREGCPYGFVVLASLFVRQTGDLSVFEGFWVDQIMWGLWFHQGFDVLEKKVWHELPDSTKDPT